MPSNNIANFAGQFLKGGVRPHLFEVNGSFPGTGQDEKIPFLVKAAQLPASTVGVIEVPWRGRKVKVPGDRTFADWEISVVSDGAFELRHSFEEWKNRFQDTFTNVSEVKDIIECTGMDLSLIHI